VLQVVQGQGRQAHDSAALSEALGRTVMCGSRCLGAIVVAVQRGLVERPGSVSSAVPALWGRPSNLAVVSACAPQRRNVPF
jgi:hypothetical protein